MTPRSVDLRQVRRNFSASALDYDRHARTQQRVVGRLLDLTLAADFPDGPVLDLGTGTGRLARALAERRPGTEVLLADIAHGMTRHAAALLPGAAPFDADAAALPVRDGALAMVLCASVYQWLSDLEEAFRESFRVLVPGGVFAFALFGDRTLFELRQSHRRAAAECGRRSSHVQSFPTPGQVGEALAKAGFATRCLVVEDEVETHADVGAVLASLKRIGARNAAAGRPAGLASRRVMRRMVEIYEGEFAGEGSVPATFEVIYGVASRPAG